MLRTVVCMPGGELKNVQLCIQKFSPLLLMSLGNKYYSRNLEFHSHSQRGIRSLVQQV